MGLNNGVRGGSVERARAGLCRGRTRLASLPEPAPAVYSIRPGSSNCGGARGGCSGCCAAPKQLSRCARMRLITPFRDRRLSQVADPLKGLSRSWHQLHFGQSAKSQLAAKHIGDATCLLRSAHETSCRWPAGHGQSPCPSTARPLWRSEPVQVTSLCFCGPSPVKWCCAATPVTCAVPWTNSVGLASSLAGRR